MITKVQCATGLGNEFAPVTRYAEAMTASAILSGEIHRLVNAGAQVSPGEQLLAAALARDLGETSARLVRAAAIAQVAAEG